MESNISLSFLGTKTFAYRFLRGYAVARGRSCKRPSMAATDVDSTRREPHSTSRWWTLAVAVGLRSQLVD